MLREGLPGTPHSLHPVLLLLCLSLFFPLYPPHLSDPVPFSGPRLMAAISTQMYRLTLRTSKEPVSRHLCELLAQQF